MNEQDFRDNWDGRKNQARMRWDRLTEEEVERVNGQEETLIGLLTQKYGMSLGDAEAEVASWLRSESKGPPTPSQGGGRAT